MKVLKWVCMLLLGILGLTWKIGLGLAAAFGEHSQDQTGSGVWDGCNAFGEEEAGVYNEHGEWVGEISGTPIHPF